MNNLGLTKLVEELGELTQVAAKKIAYMDTDAHPDGSSMRERLVEEIGDVYAAIAYVVGKLHLPLDSIQERKQLKLKRYHEWDNHEND